MRDQTDLLPLSAEEMQHEAEARALLAEERRRSAREKKKFITQMTPWEPGQAPVPAEVIIEDLSDTGARIIHDQPLALGMRHLLTVPRPAPQRPIVQEYVVVRCEPRGGETFTIGLRRVGAEETTFANLPRRRVTSKRLKLLFLLFGIFGLLIATFAPL